MPKQQVNRTREENDPAASSHKPMLDEDKKQQSQMEGPAAYAPHEDLPASEKKPKRANKDEMGFPVGDESKWG